MGAWSQGEHELLPLMTKGEIVDEIVIDANMDLQWPHEMSLMPPSPTYSALIPYRVGLCLEAPYTQLTRSLYHLAEDIEELGDGLEALVDDEEALNG